MMTKLFAALSLLLLAAPASAANWRDQLGTASDDD